VEILEGGWMLEVFRARIRYEGEVEREYKVWAYFGVEERRFKEKSCGIVYEFSN
jgi:hypothetical protein